VRSGPIVSDAVGVSNLAPSAIFFRVIGGIEAGTVVRLAHNCITSVYSPRLVPCQSHRYRTGHPYEFQMVARYCPRALVQQGRSILCSHIAPAGSGCAVNASASVCTVSGALPPDRLFSSTHMLARSPPMAFFTYTTVSRLFPATLPQSCHIAPPASSRRIRQIQGHKKSQYGECLQRIAKTFAPPYDL
jgi:hypothetical protein